MLLSKLKKLLHPTQKQTSQNAKKQWEATCVSEAESKMINDDVETDVPEGETETVETGVPEGESETVETDVLGGPTIDTKSHLKSSVPRAASAPCGAMSKQEIREARELFSGLDDAEIQRLYKKVTQ